MKLKDKSRTFGIITLLFIFSTFTFGVQNDLKFLQDNNTKSPPFILSLQNIEYEMNYSSYFGGDNWDSGEDIFVDDFGNLYVMGDTSSSNFPIVGPNADPSYNGGSDDIFISKFSSNRTLIFSTYFGGASRDMPASMFVDSKSNIYITGNTISTNFPIEGINANSTYGGGIDSYVSKFSSNGTLIFSTYLGGRNSDYAKAIFVDQLSNIYVSGSTTSPDFPIVGNYANSTQLGTEGFVTKFTPNGEIVYSTYIGGSNNDQADSIAVDASYNIYIVGRTYSSDFPTVGVNSNSTFGGESDAYVSKFASDGVLIYSTYLGGSVLDNANSISIDTFGNMYVSGETKSINFPIEGINANSTYGGGNLDGFVSKISAGGALIFSTFLGGSDYEIIFDLQVDNFGNIYVTGETGSADFPSKGINANSTYGGGTDGFVSKFNSSGTIEFSTFLGGTGGDSMRAVTSDVNQNIYVTGITNSLNFPIIGSNTAFGGGPTDGTITMYTSIDGVPVTLTTTPTITETVNITQTTTITETLTDLQISTATETVSETEATTSTETTTMTGSASTFTTETTFVEKTTVIQNNTIISTQTSDSSLSSIVFVLSLVLITMGIRRKKLK